jgi:deferrochelatase/peroxidase EfeB
VNTTFDSKDIQGNIIRGYRRKLVRHLILEVVDAPAARRFLGASAAGNSADVPAITREETWTVRPKSCFNIGLTYEGLKALGISAKHLAEFPTEFVEGMTKRAPKLGDFGDSAPSNWPAPFDQPAKVHIVASIHADVEEDLDQVEKQVAQSFNVIGVRNGRGLADSKVFFGFMDGISQPRFEEAHDPAQKYVNEPADPLGTILLGYPTSLENLEFRVPSPKELGMNGSFNAFRVLGQNVNGFEAYLDKAAAELLDHPDGDKLLAPGDEKKIGKGLDRTGALREIVAAQMCGRWRNGVPYASSPDTPFPNPEVSLTNFDYDHGSRCPVGSHLRRANPRGGKIVQRIANYTRRLVRRGMSYGPDFDPSKPDDAERGLLGNFIGANLGAQFEAVMCDWLNLGLQDPNITGANDPLLGANSPETSWFDMTLKDGGSIRLRGFPRFVNTRGGAYTFLPSLTAIAYLSKL